MSLRTLASGMVLNHAEQIGPNGRPCVVLRVHVVDGPAAHEVICFVFGDTLGRAALALRYGDEVGVSGSLRVKLDRQARRPLLTLMVDHLISLRQYVPTRGGPDRGQDHVPRAGPPLRELLRQRLDSSVGAPQSVPPPLSKDCP